MILPGIVTVTTSYRVVYQAATWESDNLEVIVLFHILPAGNREVVPHIEACNFRLGFKQQRMRKMNTEKPFSHFYLLNHAWDRSSEGVQEIFAHQICPTWCSCNGLLQLSGRLVFIGIGKNGLLLITNGVGKTISWLWAERKQHGWCHVARNRCLWGLYTSWEHEALTSWPTTPELLVGFLGLRSGQTAHKAGPVQELADIRMNVIYLPIQKASFGQQHSTTNRKVLVVIWI